MRSQIVIHNDFESFIEELKSSIEPHRLHIFLKDEFKIEDAKEVIKEAYVASEDEKVIALFASKYNIYAQNALLKILEEPPKNVVFLLVSKVKSTFLPTILSRLPVEKRSKSEQEKIEFEKFDLQKLYDLTKMPKPSKSQTKAILQGMLEYAIKKKFALSERELDYFAKAVELVELNSNPSNLFITAGLILLKHQKRKR